MGPIVPISEFRTEEPGSARRSGEAVIVALEDASVAARHREAEVRQTVAKLAEDLRSCQERVAAIEAVLNETEARAEGAEQWLANILQHVEAMTQDMSLRGDDSERMEQGRYAMRANGRSSFGF